LARREPRPPGIVKAGLVAGGLPPPTAGCAMAALMTRRASWKLGLQRTLFAAILVTFALGFLAAWAQGPKSSPPNTDDPTQPGYVSGGSGNSSGAPQRARRNLTEADRARLLQSIEEQLAQMACKDRSRKSPTDFFVVSMIDAQGQRASVDYRVIQGLKETAAAVADFLAGAAAGSVRDWEPLARVKSEKAGQRQIELAKAQSIEGRLERFPLSGRGKKSPDDVFVVGTAELRLSDRHADVRFQAVRRRGILPVHHRLDLPRQDHEALLRPLAAAVVSTATPQNAPGPVFGDRAIWSQRNSTHPAGVVPGPFSRTGARTGRPAQNRRGRLRPCATVRMKPP
jgi:hypothetical protein